MVYKATITTTDPGNPGNEVTETCTGLAGGTFRKRHYGHVNDMKEENEDETGKKGTTLSRHIHSLRRAGKEFSISWDLLEKKLTG